MRRKTKKFTTTTINTNALPDIIFMLLFFFMIVTVMRKDTLLVKIKLPTASEARKLEKSNQGNHIYIGSALDASQNANPVIRVQDAFVPLEKLPQAIRKLVAHQTVSVQKQERIALKVDEKVEMGIVSDLKLALRKEGQLQLDYLTIKPVAE